MSSEPLLVVIVGPTGSGKTSLSIELATRFGGEIVNCDSVAMVREFAIGTAKPSVEEQARAPHHLFNAVDPSNYTTAGEYARMARKTIEQIRERAAVPIVVGGTGLYMRALLEGLFPGPERSGELRHRLRERARERGSRHLTRILTRLDSAAAQRIHPNDIPKLIRAIEVCLQCRGPMSQQWSLGRDALRGFRILRIGLNPNRALLYARIDRRVEAMFAAGLIDETRTLWKRYGTAAHALSSIGYRQVLRLLRGDVDRQRTIVDVQQAHRNYAKRQMTWFRREPEVIWIEGFGDEPAVQEQASALVATRLI